MNITIKCVRNTVISNLVILTLAGCASTPAPWVSVDDSSMSKKNEAQAQLESSIKEANEASLAPPASSASSEPEPISLQSPEMEHTSEVIMPIIVEDEPVEAAPIVATPAVVAESGNNDIMAMLETNYAVQVFAGSEESVEKFKVDKDLSGLMTVKTERSGNTIYVLVDIYSDRAEAETAAAHLEVITGSKPWVRSLGGLQKIAVK